MFCIVFVRATANKQPATNSEYLKIFTTKKTKNNLQRKCDKVVFVLICNIKYAVDYICVYSKIHDKESASRSQIVNIKLDVIM